MRVLIIGGTRFVGRHLAEEALARGHDLVLFNRGRTNPDLFPGVCKVHGDRRTGGLEGLGGEDFDAVFDTCAYHPDDVAATASLAQRVRVYALVSTVSVYRDPLPACADETAPLWSLDQPVPREFSTPEEYGRLKACCEMRASEIFGRGALIVRPGLVVGPHDYTDRLASWIHRLIGRNTLLAGDPAQPLQLIDVRDLAAWMMRAAEAGVTGRFNAVGPERPLRFEEFLRRAAAALRVNPGVVWAGDQFLIDHRVELPLCIPSADHAFFELSSARAIEAGLTLRPLEMTVSQVQTSLASRPAGLGGSVGLSADREDRLLALLAPR